MIAEEFADNFPIRDEGGAETGRMEIKLSCKDYVANPYGLENERDLSSFKISKYAERDIIGKIAERFA
jgi:hypothetical protein